MKQIFYEDISQIKELVFDKRILLIHGSSYDGLPLKGFFHDLDTIEFTDFTVNPLKEQVEKAYNLFEETKCDIIIAIGGGSSIDVAKCIKLANGVPLIAIPTTAGSGSESTRHAVIYCEGVKQSISDSRIIPEYVVLIPELLHTLPVYQKKCTMLDALCQAIESWWSKQATEESIEYSRRAIKLIKKSWKEYIEGDTYSSQKNILLAANYSGRAINITTTTAAHAMSYKLTTLYGMPHGHAVSICMREVWKYVATSSEWDTDNRLNDINELIDYEWYCNLLDQLQMKRPVADNREREIELLTGSVNHIRLKNNPVELKEEVIEEMYERIIADEC